MQEKNKSALNVCTAVLMTPSVVIPLIRKKQEPPWRLPLTSASSRMVENVALPIASYHLLAYDARCLLRSCPSAGHQQASADTDPVDRAVRV